MSLAQMENDSQNKILSVQLRHWPGSNAKLCCHSSGYESLGVFSICHHLLREPNLPVSFFSFLHFSLCASLCLQFTPVPGSCENVCLNDFRKKERQKERTKEDVLSLYRYPQLSCHSRLLLVFDVD